MRAPGAHRARIALGQPDALELLRRVQPERRVLVAQRRREAVAQPAAVSDDEDVLAGNDLEQITVDQPQRLDLHRELLPELALERLLRRLADLEPATRQLPLDAIVAHEHGFTRYEQDTFDRDRVCHARSLALLQRFDDALDVADRARGGGGAVGNVVEGLDRDVA